MENQHKKGKKKERLISLFNNQNRFEAFDEPWKIQFNKGDQNWEDKWGLMTIDRKLKPGVKIPDCGGNKTSAAASSRRT